MKLSTPSLGLALLASLALAAPGAAQEPVPAPVAGPEAPTNDSAELPRILFLSNGDVVRARARHGALGWEIQNGRGQWSLLGGGAVTRTVLERDALADAKRLEQQISEGPRAEQNTRRVALAEWLAQQGLIAETLEQIDRVLAADPDQRQALLLMGNLAPKLAIAALDKALASEDSTLAVMRVAAAGSPTLREIAVQRLGSGGATEELRNDLREQLTSHSPRLRALSALALRRIYPGEKLALTEVKELINRSVLDGAEEVRAEAARALRDTQDPYVTIPAMRALSSANPRLRENSIQALGAMGYPVAVEPLVNYLARVNSAAQSSGSSATAGGSIFIGTQTAYVQDFDVEVANSAAVADPQVNVLIEGSVLDAKVLGMYTASFATEARLVRTALRDLTGVDHGSSNRAWLAWWDANKDKWSTPLPPRTVAQPTTPGGGR